MKALTFWPEWVYAIHHLGKRVENRGWALPIGVTFALHAGKNIGGRPGIPAMLESAEALRIMSSRAGSTYILRSGDPERSSILGVFRVTSVDKPGEGDLDGWRVPEQFGNRLKYWPLTEPIFVKGAQGMEQFKPITPRTVR